MKLSDSMNLYVSRKPPVTSVYEPTDPLLRKRWRWNPRKAAENLLVAVVVACVVFGLPLMMFVSCTGGR